MFRSPFVLGAALALVGCSAIEQPDPGCVGADCVLPDGGMLPVVDAGHVGQLGDCRVVGCPSRTSHCKNPWTIASSTSTGTCDTATGVCNFDFVEKACEQPTAGSCDGSQLTWYVSPGHCVEIGPEAHCEYTARTSTCTDGCVGGRCSNVSCATNAHVCGNACVTNVDVGHCGTVNCGTCGAPANATPSCASATCAFACNAGYAWCGGACQTCPAGTAVGGESCGGTRCVARWCDTTAGYFNGNGRCYHADPVLNVTTSNAAGPRLAIGPTGNVHVAYTDVPSGISSFRLGYKKWDGTAWQSVTTAIPVSEVLAIAVDAQDRPAIAFNGSTSTADKIQLAAWNGTAFVVTDLPGETFGLVAAGGRDGSLHLAWLADSAAPQLRHAVFRGGQLTTEVIGLGHSLDYPAIQVDAQGQAVIATMDETAKEFIVLRQTAGSWASQVVDGAGDLNEPALRLGPSGIPYLLGSSFGNVVLVTPSSGMSDPRYLPSGTPTPDWLIDGDGHFVGVGGDSNGLTLVSDDLSAASPALTRSSVVGSAAAAAQGVSMAADSRGGYFVAYRAYNGQLRLFHFQ